MLLLTSAADVVQVVTSAATPLDVHASWMDYNGTTVTPGRLLTQIAAAATTTIVTAPAAATQRNAKTLNIKNTDAAASVGIVVRQTDGVATVELIEVTLLAGEVLTYVDEDGWEHFDADGQLRTAQAVVGISVTSAELSAVSAQAASAIASEVSNRTSADNALSAAVSVVSNALSNEISVRTSAVNAVSNALSNEASVRTSADNALSNAISAVSAQAASAIASETSNRTSADAALSLAVNVVSNALSAFKVAVSAVSARTTAGASVHGLQSIVDALSSRISQVPTSVTGAGEGSRPSGASRPLARARRRRLPGAARARGARGRRRRRPHLLRRKVVDARHIGAVC